MAAPLIAMMVQGAIRLATPTVAKLLTKSGFKKAAKGATKAGRVNNFAAPTTKSEL